MKVYLTQDTSAGGKFWEIKVGEKSYTIRYGKLGCSGRTMSPKKFASRKKCETNAKALIRKKKDAGYCEQKTKGRKRKQLDYSSDEDASDSSEQPPAKKRKTNTRNTRKGRKKKKKAPTPTPSSDSSAEQDDDDEDGYDSNDIKNEKVLRPMLEVSSVLLQDKDEKQKYEVVINENKTYSIVEGKIGTKGRKSIQRADSKQGAFDEALHLLVLKMRNKWSIVESSEDEEEPSSSEEEEADGIFSETVFVLSGGFSKSQGAIKKLIRDNDGTVKTSTTAEADVVLVKTVGAKLDSTKCAAAIKLKVPIVGEDYLHDCIAKKKELKIDKYIIEESEAESESDDEDIKMNDKNKKKKTKPDTDRNRDNDADGKGPKESATKTQKFRGSAPVDEHFSRGPDWSVYEEDGVVYDAMLNQTNIGHNNNKMYCLHVLKHDASGRYCTFFRWARVGYKGQMSEKDGTKEQCIRLFEKKFLDKTLNHWDDRDDFEFRAGKYMYLPMDYGADAEGEDDNAFDGSEEHKCESKLDDGIQELVQLIFDKDMMDTQMKEIGYDAAKLPLGKVSKSIITKAYEILQQIENEINKGNEKSNKNKNNDSDADDGSGSDSDYATKKRKRKSRKSNRKVESESLEALSSEYYTLIPHEFGFKNPPSITSEKRLNVEMKLIEALSEIAVAKRLLAGRDKGDDKHPIDKNFDLLKCDMQSIDKKSEEFAMLSTYVSLTHAATHNRFKLSVERAYALDREGSGARFAEFGADKNRMLLWHGSRLTNFVGIISQGLRIAPPEAPVTGYMFGKGVYFADMCSKSANYCATSVQNNTGLILLCEVALGDMNELLHSDYYADQLPKGKKSTKGCGRTTPDPSTYVTLENGCVVPSGKGVVDEELQSSLLYNEYIVYDTAQIKMKYLLRLNFDYGDASF